MTMEEVVWGMVNRMKLEKAEEDNKKMKNIFDFVGIIFGKKIMFLAIVSLFAVIITGFLGRITARHQKEFLTTTIKNQDYLIVRLYQDALIVTPFDRETMTIKRKPMIIQYTDQQEPLPIRNEKLGTLKFEQ